MFSSDGSRLAARLGRRQVVQIWETDSSRLVTTIRGHDKSVQGAGFVDAEGKTMVSSGIEGFLKKWNVSQARPFVVDGSAFEPGNEKRLHWIFGRDRPVRGSDLQILRGNPGFNEVLRRELTCISGNGQYLAELQSDGNKTQRLKIWQATGSRV